ncbi:MAG: GIY-YIG nuclease family protein [Candidatus Omnitrophica bacterium]|nr:GIY-YIG nuclease family protein [Candidatus Omnitrophota bacterium]
MYYVYVIKSIKSSKIYVGFTNKTPEERLKEHNSGTTIWTRKERPFTMIYWEEYTSKDFEKKREIFEKW